MFIKSKRPTLDMSTSTEIRKSSSFYTDPKANGKDSLLLQHLPSSDDDDDGNVKSEDTLAHKQPKNSMILDKAKTSRSYLSALLEATEKTKEREFRKSSSHYLSNEDTELDSEDIWKSVINDAAYFQGHDALFGDVIAVIFRYPDSSEKLSSLIISKHGQNFFKGINYSRSSKYYPAVENLRTKEFQNSRVRKCLAVSLLKTYALLNHGVVISLLRQADLPLNFDWDETMAGELASQMTTINSRSAASIGKYLLSMGYGRDCLKLESHIVDVVYENDITDDELMDKNNILAFLLGEQLEYLFDSFVEYSPEATEECYKQPSRDPSDAQKEAQSVKVIYEQLINDQTEFTVQLVQFMQKQIVPLRVKVLNGEIQGYTTNRLNHVFPPTIDEVTRINCIFLDMLKAAEPYGAFEILKACGTTIPYFYKACMRNKAATKLFSQEYAQLLLTLEQTKKSDLLSYDLDTSQKLVRLSSSNLAKIQLLLQKLLRTKDWRKCKDNERNQVTRLYGACNETIMSFASDELRSYDQHMFNEKGEILADFAKEWPKELKNGWLTRRVVGIFDVTDMISSDIENRAVLGVFNDFLVVFKITDKSYYLRYWNEQRLREDPSNAPISWPLVSDILMHAIINEVVPSALPVLKVTSCIEVKDIVASYYVYDGASYIKLFGDNFVGQFRVDRQSGKTVSDVISKAKILGKSEAFHLFKNTIDNNVIYYTAHEKQSYRDETYRAPLLITLNSELDPSLLSQKNLYGLIALNLVDSDHVSMKGMTIMDPKFSNTFLVDELTEQLAQQVETMIPGYLSICDPLLRNIILSGEEYLVSSVINILGISEDEWDGRRANLEEAEQSRLQQFSGDRIMEKIEEYTNEESPSENIENEKRAKAKGIPKRKHTKWGFLRRFFNHLKRSKDKKGISKKSNRMTIKSSKTFIRKDIPTLPAHHKSVLSTSSEKENKSAAKPDKQKVPDTVEIRPNKEKQSAPHSRSSIHSQQRKSPVLSQHPVYAKSRPFSLPARRPDYITTPARPLSATIGENNVQHTAFDQNKLQKKAVIPMGEQQNKPISSNQNGTLRESPSEKMTKPSGSTNPEFHLGLVKPTSEKTAALISKDKGSLVRKRSKIHRVESSIHIHKELKKTNANISPVKEEGRVKSWAEVRRAKGDQNDKSISSKDNGELDFKKTEINNNDSNDEKVPDVVKKITESRIKSSDSFYDKFKNTVKTQEAAVQKNGIAPIPDSRTNTLSKSSIIYSPSVRAKLSKLSETEKKRKKGANWVRLSSVDISVDGTMKSDQNSSSTLSTEETLEPEVAKSPYPPEDDTIFHDSIESDENTINGTVITAAPVTISQAQPSTPNSSLSKVSSGTVKIKAALSHSTENNSDKNTSSYTGGHARTASYDDSSNTFTDFSTLKQLGWSDVGMETILGDSSDRGDAKNKQMSFDNSIDSDNTYSHDYLASVNISAAGFNGMKSTDNKWDHSKSHLGKTTTGRKGQMPKTRKRLPLAMSSASLCDIIGDDSYMYIGEILAGNIKIGDKTISQDNSSLSLSGDIGVEYDNLYSQQLRESSLKYLASIIGSGEDSRV